MSTLANRLVFAVGLSMLASVAGGDDSATLYEQRRPSRDGIGKIYMGREIALVMGYQGAQWLERPGRQAEERTDLLIDNLALRGNETVADIGAGTGYFTEPIARRLPEGRVLAVDLQPEMLRFLEQRIARTQLENVESVLGRASDPGLPHASIDLALFVDVYHELSQPFEVMQAVVSALRPGGRVVLVEYRGEDPSVQIKPLHKMTQRQAKKEMRAVGLEWVETIDVLPQQHLMVFRRDGV